jgi:hypothetical protein
LLPGLRPDRFVWALRGTFPAYGEAHGASVITLVHLNKSRDVTLDDERQEGSVCEILAIHANDPVQRPPSLLGGPTCMVLSLSASKQASTPRHLFDSITKPTSEGTARTPRDGETMYIELSRPSTPDVPVTEDTNPDLATVQPEGDELGLLSLANRRLRAIQEQHASLELENTCLRHQVTALREDLAVAKQGREDALRHGCETIEQLHGLVEQHEQRGVGNKECILRLTKDMNRATKRLRRDHVIFHLTSASARRKLKQANSRLEEARRHIPRHRELSDVGVDTYDLVQYMSTGIMHQPSVDVRTSKSHGVQAGESVKHNTHHESRGTDHKAQAAAFTFTTPRAVETEELDAGVRLKLAEAELGHLRAKLAFYEQSSGNTHALQASFAKIPVNTSALADRHTVPGFTECVARLEQEADRYLRRRRKQAAKAASAPATHNP